MSNKANFVAARFGGSFEMWSPDRLIIATVTKRLGGEAWLEVVSSRHERYEEVSAIVEDTQEKVIEAFRDGSLTAYVHKVETGLFYVIPAPIWDGFDAMGYLDGRLYLGVMDDDYHRSMPTAFLDTPIMILGDAATAWLRGAVVSSLPAVMKPAVPSGKLEKWFDGLSEDQRGLKNEEFVQLARDAFPDHTVGKHRFLDFRRLRDGHREAGRPKISGE